MKVFRTGWILVVGGNERLSGQGVFPVKGRPVPQAIEDRTTEGVNEGLNN